MKVIMNGYEVDFRVRELTQQKASQLDAREFLLYLKRVFLRARGTVLDDKLLLNRIDKDIDSMTWELMHSGDRRVD